MAKFRKKSVVIEAFKLNERGLIGEDWFWDAVTRNDIITHCFGKHYPDPAWCEIKTFKGTMIANAGDYIIKGVNGEIYPCKADIFQQTYTEDKPKTNADRIRSMSDEELSEFLTHMNPTNCQDCAFSHGWRCQPDSDDYSDFEKCKEGRKRWLQKPAEGE